MRSNTDLGFFYQTSYNTLIKKVYLTDAMNQGAYDDYEYFYDTRFASSEAHQIFGLSGENLLILVSKTVGSKKVSFIESRDISLNCPSLEALSIHTYNLLVTPLIRFSSHSVSKSPSNPSVSTTPTPNPTLSILSFDVQR